jgi:hypothetical protein
LGGHCREGGSTAMKVSWLTENGVSEIRVVPRNFREVRLVVGSSFSRRVAEARGAGFIDSDDKCL